MGGDGWEMGYGGRWRRGKRGGDKVGFWGRGAGAEITTKLRG